MKRKSNVIWVVAVMALVFWTMAPVSAVNAQDKLKFSCSAQVYEAFEKDTIDAFTKETGNEVDVYVSSSGSAVYRLMNDFADIASTTRALYRRHSDFGYVQTPFCKDPIVIITKKGCDVDDVSEEELQEIFSGNITNWKQMGGADLPIVIAVPGEHTGANKNFRRQVMKHKEIKYDYMTYKSTQAIELIKYLPCGAVSFISQGAAIQEKDLKVIKVNGYLPNDKGYPYYQTFYFITKGEAVGAAGALIDFSFSKTGKKIMKKRGMLSIQR